jgi:hypothetical protein
MQAKCFTFQVFISYFKNSYEYQDIAQAGAGKVTGHRRNPLRRNGLPEGNGGGR